MHKLKQKWGVVDPNKGDSFKSSQETGTVLGFENLSFPFVSLAVGMIMSSLMSLVEKFFLHPGKRGNQKLNKQTLFSGGLG